MNRIVGILLLFAVGTHGAGAALVFSAPPRESQTAGKEFYGPFIDYLSKVLGEDIVYRHPENWIQYAREMRAGQYDIVFDGPHFSAWRMKKTDHVPVVRLNGQLGFVVIVHSDNNDIKSVDDLIGRSICGLASPNLGTVSVFSLFSNPVNQPLMVNINGGPKEVLQTFLNKEQCVAAVIRDSMYNALPQDKKRLMKIVAKSKSMPNQTITMSAKILEHKKEAVYRALLSDEGFKAADKIFTRFTKDSRFFIPAEPGEYKDLEYLLEGVVYGW
jgi:ABC-type phosphate/phosphonate transport system substrate-binding protein